MTVKKRKVAKKKVTLKRMKINSMSNDFGKKRFAILCRVSTERQGDKGVSLEVQKETLIDYVEMIGGAIPDDCIYIGQEHSSFGYERRIFDRLLKNATLGKFDAVMFADATRIGRSKTVTEEAVEIFRQNKIELYLGMRKYDLTNPEDGFNLTILSATSQLATDQSTQKSFLAKVKLANKGWCMQGKPPYGRITKNNDKGQVAEWVIDTNIQKEIFEAYNLYINKGLSFKQIANRFGVITQTMRTRLQTANQSEFKQKIPCKRFGLEKIIITKVPQILSDKQVDEIKSVAKANRKFREPKNEYPLVHRVICANCGSVLSGSTGIRPAGKTQVYYRHVSKYASDCCVKNINARALEKAVFDKFGQILREEDSLVNSIKRALIKTDSKKEDLESEISLLVKRVKLEKTIHDNLFNKLMALEKTTGPMFEKIKSAIDKSDKKLQDLKYQHHSVKRELDMMVIEIPQKLDEKVRKYLFALTGIAGHAPLYWNFEDKKKLAEFFFGRKGNGMGVYISLGKDNELGKFLKYEIKAIIGGGKGVVSEYIALNDDGSLNEESAKGAINIGDLKKLLENIECVASETRSLLQKCPSPQS